VHDALTRLLEPVRGLRSVALVGALALGSMAMVTRRAPDAPRPEPDQLMDQTVHCIEAPQPAEPRVSALEPITLEHRWLVGSFASPAEVDAALGTTIAAWEPFTYMFDSQPRMAVASEIYPTTALHEPVFGRDEYGGIWLTSNATQPRRTRDAVVMYTRDIYLMPAGSSFRGPVKGL
jgi:hypothetical protein